MIKTITNKKTESDNGEKLPKKEEGIIKMDWINSQRE